MDGRIAEFAEVLRQNGVRVSTSEVVDAVRAATEVGVQDKALFRAVLRTTLIKREQYVDVFRRAFDAFFTGAAQTLDELEPSLVQRLAERGLLPEESLEVLREALREPPPGMSPLARAVLDRKSTRLNSSHSGESRMPSSA